MTTKTVAQLLSQDVTLQNVTVKGWVRTFRANRFIALNDGSTINNIQCVVDFENFDEALLKRITTGAAIHVTGELVESQGKGQSVEIVVKTLDVLGDSDPETYPIQPKKHSFEFLRENAHLRVRTNTFSAVMRVRSKLIEINPLDWERTLLISSELFKSAKRKKLVSNPIWKMNERLIRSNQ